MTKKKKEEPEKSSSASPLIHDLSSIAKYGGNQLAGAANIAGYGIASGVDYLTGTNLSEAVAPGVERAFGITPKPRIENPQSQPVKKSAPLTKAAPAPQGKEIDIDRYKDIYEAAADMSDNGFVNFVKAHGKDVPGIGYAKDEKGKIHRQVQRPEPNINEGRLGIGPMSVRDAEIAQRLLQGEDTADTRRLAVQNMADAHKDRIDTKEAQIFANQLKINSPSNINGEPNERVGLFRMATSKMPIHESYRPAAQNIVATFERDYKRSLVEARLPDTPANKLKAMAKFEELLTK